MIIPYFNTTVNYVNKQPQQRFTPLFRVKVFSQAVQFLNFFLSPWVR